MLKLQAIKLPVLLFLAAFTVGCATSPQQTGTVDSTSDSTPISAPKAKPVKMSGDARSAYERALLSAKAGREQEAMDLFGEMTRNHPGVSLGFTNLGMLQLRAGQYDAAQQSLAEAVRLNPGDAVAQNHLGVALREQGQFKQSETAYLTALKINDSYANAHLNLGILYDLYLQDLGRALQHYDRYQVLTGSQDDTVAKWIVDLERRAKN
jgi:tetratricopeptide (TPR) repeat protein